MNYELIQPVVDAICESLETEPETWKFSTFGIKRKGKFNDMELDNTHFTHRWTGHTWEKVFSTEQGNRIGVSVTKARQMNSTESQKELLKSLNPSKDTPPTLWQSLTNWLRAL